MEDSYELPKTEVRYVEGFDQYSNPPDFARAAGLGCRFAVVQDTYRPDCVDMYFDELLWLSLVDFARTRAGETWIGLTEGPGEEVTAEVFLTTWHATPDEDREPRSIRVRDGGRLSLIIQPVYWCSVGGPDIYADSYTYEVYAPEPMGPAVVAHLEAANCGGWDLTKTAIAGTWTEAEVVESRLSWWQKLWRGLKGQNGHSGSSGLGETTHRPSPPIV